MGRDQENERPEKWERTNHKQACTSWARTTFNSSQISRFFFTTSYMKWSDHNKHMLESKEQNEVLTGKS